MQPLVSIIVPCYNQANYLSECLDSVRAQSYNHWECLIVDDGSPDNTPEVARQFEKQDRRFRYIKKENGGLPSARNCGIHQAKGEYILPLDADDKIHRDYITAALPVFQSNSQIAVVYCQARLFGTVNRRWYLPAFSPERLSKDNIVFCSAVIRKDMLDQVGGYDERLIYGKEDWDLWIGIHSAGGQFHRINKVLFFYRIKQQSMIADFRKNYENNFYTHSIILSKHQAFFTDAMIKRMYEPLYVGLINDARELLLHLFYRVCRFL